MLILLFCDSESSSVKDSVPSVIASLVSKILKQCLESVDVKVRLDGRGP